MYRFVVMGMILLMPGLMRLVESMLEELKESNINVNCIMPSVIDTEANRRAMPTAEYSKWVKPHDLAKVLLFLCSVW